MLSKWESGDDVTPLSAETPGILSTSLRVTFCVFGSLACKKTCHTSAGSLLYPVHFLNLRNMDFSSKHIEFIRYTYFLIREWMTNFKQQKKLQGSLANSYCFVQDAVWSFLPHKWFLRAKHKHDPRHKVWKKCQGQLIFILMPSKFSFKETVGNVHS